MPKINLAAEVFRARLIARRRNTLYALSVAVLVLVLGVWGIALLLTSATERRAEAVKKEIAVVDARLNARKDDVKSIRLFARRLELLRSRLENHQGWVPLLEELERLVPGSVRMASLEGATGTGEVEATAVVPNLDTAADLVASLQSAAGKNETMFTDVDVTGVSAESAAGGEYTVSLRLKADPKRFRLNAAAASAEPTAPPAEAAAPAAEPSPVP